MSSAISIANISKFFGRTKALDCVTLDIPPGVVYGILGPNGAGKTTLVRILSTIIRPTSGTALVGGHDILDEPEEVRASIGVLPEDTGLYDRLTAVETLRFFGAVHGVPDDVLEARIADLLRLLGLYDRRNDRAGKYSKGMRQKLALARALVHDPPILMLDEPTLGLDVMSARAIREYVKSAASSGKTVLLTTNNMHEAELLCSHLAIIDMGAVRTTGTIRELEQISKAKDLEEVFVRLVKGEDDVQG